MMRRKTCLLALVAVMISIGCYWYYFVATLRLTDIAVKPDNAIASIFVNVIDFDTGLTRYDLYKLKGKSIRWQERIKEVTAIQDPQRRNAENMKLLAEMMEDPSTAKIIKKIGRFGADIMLSILGATR
jgi:hypothetical protein